MPCSPVQVPSMAMARGSAARRIPRIARSSGLFMSISTSTWKLPSPTWPTIGAISPCGDVGFRLGDAFGQPRDRHADIGRQALWRRAASVSDAHRRRAAPSRVLRAPRRPSSTGTARRHTLRDLAKRLRLFGDAGLAAVELHEQARALRIVELRIVLHRPHLQRVDQFDARHRNAHLDGHDHARCRPPRPLGNGQTPPEIACGMPCRASASAR
jgi:hypothetical protein